MTIWKYQLPLQQEFEITMKQGARILSFQTLNGIPCLWAQVDPKVEDEIRTFNMVGTSHEVSENVNYIGTTQIETFVRHLYENLTKQETRS